MKTIAIALGLMFILNGCADNSKQVKTAQKTLPPTIQNALLKQLTASPQKFFVKHVCEIGCYLHNDSNNPFGEAQLKLGNINPSTSKLALSVTIPMYKEKATCTECEWTIGEFENKCMLTLHNAQIVRPGDLPETTLEHNHIVDMVFKGEYGTLGCSFPRTFMFSIDHKTKEVKHLTIKRHNSLHGGGIRT